MGYLDPLANGVSPAVPAGEWCNGNTAVFGTVILGSSPSSPATFRPLRSLSQNDPRAALLAVAGARRFACRSARFARRGATTVNKNG